MEHGPEHGYHPIEESRPEEPFNAADELKNVRHLSEAERALPKEDKRRLRREHLEELKDSLEKQRLGLASLIDDLRITIDINSGVTTDQLKDMVDAAAPGLRLTKAQRAEMTLAIDRFARRHEAIEKRRAEFPDDRDLFAACFGDRPQGAIEVGLGPMTITFRCHDLEDYTLAYNYDQHKGDGKPLTDSELAAAELSAAAACGQVGLPDLTSSVIIVKADKTNFGTLEHEQQHVFDSLFQPVEGKLHTLDALGQAVEKGAGAEQTATQLLPTLARQERRRLLADSRLRDEVLAYYRDGHSLADLEAILTTSNLYNYAMAAGEDIKGYPERFRKDFAELREAYLSELSEDGFTAIMDELVALPDQALIDSLTDSFDELKRNLRPWLEAIKAMRDKGYGRDEIVPLLYQQPASTWPNLAKRLTPKDDSKA